MLPAQPTSGPMNAFIDELCRNGFNFNALAPFVKLA